MRTDLLSKRLFQAGCFGLPWLWIVHVLYWRGNTSEANEALLNPDDRTYLYIERIHNNVMKCINEGRAAWLMVLS